MRRLLVAAVVVMLSVPQALSGPLRSAANDGSDVIDPIVMVQADCSAAAAREAARTGGRVLAARAVSGQCEVTLLVPQPGGRPRRVVLTVPA